MMLGFFRWLRDAGKWIPDGVRLPSEVKRTATAESEQTMTPETASAIYDILREECQADEFNRMYFVQDQTQKEDYAREWRFCGSLGFGGKFRRCHGKWYVDCYPEDETPARKLAMDKANGRLTELLDLTARG